MAAISIPKFDDDDTFDLRPVNHDHPLFEPIWAAIKGWDISRRSNALYAEATGTDVQIIIDAIEASRSTGHVQVHYP